MLLRLVVMLRVMLLLRVVGVSGRQRRRSAFVPVLLLLPSWSPVGLLAVVGRGDVDLVGRVASPSRLVPSPSCPSSRLLLVVLLRRRRHRRSVLLVVDVLLTAVERMEVALGVVGALAVFFRLVRRRAAHLPGRLPLEVVVRLLLVLVLVVAGHRRLVGHELVRPVPARVSLERRAERARGETDEAMLSA